MTNVQSRLALWLTLLLVLPVALIRAQPYDDSEVRAFLTPPEGCPAPCFMGIRPGVTTAVEALAILEDHVWVARVSDVDPTLFDRPADTGVFVIPVIYWNWSEARPAWIDPESGGELWAVNRRVRFLKIRTTFPMGDLWLTLGDPDAETTSSYTNASGHLWFYDGWYATSGLRLAASGVCPLKLADLYFGQTLLQFQARPPDVGRANSFDSVCRP